MAHSLIAHWILDRQIAFAAAGLHALVATPGREAAHARRIMYNFLELHAPQFRSLQLSTRAGLLRMHSSIWEHRPAIAKQLSDLVAEQGVPTSVDFALQRHGLALLRSAHVGARSFLKWAKRVSPRERWSGLSWSSSYWAALLARIESAKQVEALDLALANLRTLTSVSSIGTISTSLDEIERGHLGADDATPWSSLCMGLLGGQFCWPLLRVQIGGTVFGTSLPIGVDLMPKAVGGGQNDVRFCCLTKDGVEAQYIAGAPNQARVDRFDSGNLAWEFPFLFSFRNGLKVAKALWKTQHGRASIDDLRRASSVGVCADFTFAARITDLPELQEVLLYGQSAELHLSQVLLARLCAAPLPDGQATGLVDLKRGMPVRWVEDIPVKLEYPLREGTFPRVVLPASAAHRLNIDTLKQLQAAQESTLMEVVYCSTARSAADTLQRSGWRRTSFLRGVEERQAFYEAVGRLHINALQDGLIHEETADSALDIDFEATARRKPFSHAKIEYFRKRSQDWLWESDASLRLLDLPGHSIQPVNIGHWLGWLDHSIRLDAHAQTGPGLGILFLRIRSDDNEMRLWARLFSELDVTEQLWTEFQWADLVQSRTIVARILNNFICDPEVSITPPPDLIVFVDEGGKTRRRQRETFEDDFRGQLAAILTTELGALLRYRDSARERVLGATRILVLRPKVARGNLSETTAPQDHGEGIALGNEAFIALQQLCCFRDSFTAHAATFLLGRQVTARPDLAKEVARDLLDQLLNHGAIGRHRGEYFVRWKHRPQQLPHFSSEDHIAAAQALAPIIQPISTLEQSHLGSFDAWVIDEAQWHLAEAQRALSPRWTKDKSWIAAKRLLLLSLMPCQEWDLVPAMLEVGGHGAQEALDLTSDLLELESSVRGPRSSIHASRYALSIKVLAYRVREFGPTAKLDAKRKFAEIAMDRFNLGWATLGQFERSAAAVSLLSEYAFFLRILALDEYSARLHRIESDLDIVLSQYWHRERHDRDVPLSREWVQERVSDTTRTAFARAKDAKIACDLWGDAWTDMWLWQLALMRRGQFEVNQVAAVLLKFNGNSPNGSNDASALRGRMQDFRLVAMTTRRRELGLAACSSLLEWLLGEVDCLAGAPGHIAERCVCEWIAESHNCFDFVQSVGASWLSAILYNKDMVGNDIQNPIRLISKVICSDTWGCYSLISRLWDLGELTTDAQNESLLARLALFEQRVWFERGDMITLGRTPLVRSSHPPPSVVAAQSNVAAWLSSLVERRLRQDHATTLRRLRYQLVPVAIGSK